MRNNTEYEQGDLRKVAKLTGYSYDYVRRVLVYGNRSNDMIAFAASKIRESYENAKREIQAA